jgi:hypothetical protein
MKSSKPQIHSRVHSIPTIQFDDQRLTSCSGLVVFQALFKALRLKRRLLPCFKHLGRRGVYGIHTILMVLIVHVLIGHRRLRELAYYKDDPMVLRLLGLRRMPDVATITRNMGAVDTNSCEKTERVIRDIVMDRVEEEGCRRVTLDYDGSVCGTRRAAEGTAVGFNKLRKGERSYYPLLCTVAQTGQVFGMLPRSGNIHDSNSSQDFIVACVASIRERLPRVRIESRLDSAHFSEETACLLDDLGVEFSISVPFLRFPDLKDVIAARRRWRKIDETWSYFEYDWVPKKWAWAFRFVIYRQRVKVKRKGPLQLDAFEPREWDYDYKAVVTNKSVSVRALLSFHNGRGSQEGIIGELKADCQFDYIPTRRWAANRLYAQAAILAHNLTRELQMRVVAPDRATNPKRAPLWIFETLSTIRNNIIRRAGRLVRPNGQWVLTMSANKAAQEEIKQHLSAA